jgi:hypothetical protein
MHALHLSPHTVEIAKAAVQRSAVTLAGIAAVGIVALVLVAISWYLWQFT